MGIDVTISSAQCHPQVSHKLVKYLNIECFLEKSLKSTQESH